MLWLEIMKSKCSIKQIKLLESFELRDERHTCNFNIEFFYKVDCFELFFLENICSLIKIFQTMSLLFCCGNTPRIKLIVGIFLINFCFIFLIKLLFTHSRKSVDIQSVLNNKSF